jgi:hypothetical protein
MKTDSKKKDVDDAQRREGKPRSSSAMQALYLALNDIEEFERQVLAMSPHDPTRS